MSHVLHHRAPREGSLLIPAASSHCPFKPTAPLTSGWVEPAGRTAGKEDKLFAVGRLLPSQLRTPAGPLIPMQWEPPTILPLLRGHHLHPWGAGRKLLGASWPTPHVPLPLYLVSLQYVKGKKTPQLPAKYVGGHSTPVGVTATVTKASVKESSSQTQAVAGCSQRPQSRDTPGCPPAGASGATTHGASLSQGVESCHMLYVHRRRTHGAQ